MTRLSAFYADVYYSGGQATPSGTGFPERGFRQNVAGAYFQDNYRWLPNLTVNLGLRYEMASVPGEVHGLVSNLRDIYSTNLNVGQRALPEPDSSELRAARGFGLGAIRRRKDFHSRGLRDLRCAPADL